MKTSISRAAMILILACVGTSAFAQAQDNAATLEALEQAWVQATVNGDRASIDRLLDESFIETSSDGSRRSKTDVLLAPPPPAGSSQLLDGLQVRTFGDTAIVTGDNRYRAQGQTERVNFAFTDVFVRRNGAWRVVSSQYTRRGRE